MPQSRNNWLKEEDDIIIEFVATQGLKKWTKIAQTIQDRLGIEGRTGKQCRERWNNNLNPDIRKETWTEEEEVKIFELQEKFGNKWSEIAQHLPGRTDNSIKNCFYSAIRRNLRRFNRKKPESEKLKGSLKNLLRRPLSRAILMKHSFCEKEAEVQPIKIEEIPGGDEKPVNEIVCPSVSPLKPVMFSFPVTPVANSGGIGSSYSTGFRNFPEEGNFDGNFSHETGSAGIKSDCTTPLYFFPCFSPTTSFQYYFTPRNSGSN